MFLAMSLPVVLQPQMGCKQARGLQFIVELGFCVEPFCPFSTHQGVSLLCHHGIAAVMFYREGPSVTFQGIISKTYFTQAPIRKTHSVLTAKQESFLFGGVVVGFGHMKTSAIQHQIRLRL